MRRSLLAALLILTACGTPQEQCIRRETADLRTLDSLIAETERNIQRGYGIEEYTTWEWETYTCYQSQRPGPDGIARPSIARICQERVPWTETRPVAIDLNQERAKLSSMKQKRTELARRANLSIDACRRAYPE
jgi:hypothetical protein